MMKTLRTYSWALLAVTAVAVLLAVSSPAAAQCAMCKTTAEAQAPAAARALNFGILTLLVPPVAIFSAFFLVALRHLYADDPTRALRHRVTGLVRKLALRLSRK